MKGGRAGHPSNQTPQYSSLNQEVDGQHPVTSDDWMARAPCDVDNGCGLGLLSWTFFFILGFREEFVQSQDFQLS